MISASVFKSWELSFTKVCEAWPEVTMLKHAMCVVQALYGIIPEGESAQTRARQMSRCHELIHADNKSKNPTALPMNSLLKDALLMASQSTQQ